MKLSNVNPGQYLDGLRLWNAVYCKQPTTVKHVLSLSNKHFNFFHEDMFHVFNQTLLDDEYETLLYIDTWNSVTRQVASQVVKSFKV